jgi:L-malate glycosyltransferase
MTGKQQRLLPDGASTAADGISTKLRSVAICTVGELFGGVERHVLELIQGLRTEGISATLVLFHLGELAEQAHELGFDVVVLPDSNARLLATAHELAKILVARRVQVLHVHGYKATTVGALSRFWVRVPVVKTQHGLPEPSVRGAKGALRDNFYHFCERVATRVACGAVAYVTQDLWDHYRIDRAGLRELVIPNGIAPMSRADYPLPSEFAPNELNLVIVGRIDRVKGIQFALEALASDDMPAHVRLYVIGTGPCQLELEELARSSGLESKVRFLGFRRNVFPFLAQSDALLMPSLHEGLPFTLLEAMALGVPVIASRVGGLAEVLQHDDSALLVPAADPRAIAQAIVSLSTDPALASRLRLRSQEVHAAKYSRNAMTSRYIELYCDVLPQ